MWDIPSILSRVETGYDFTKVMYKELVEMFNSVSFIHGNAILKIKYYNPKILTVQHLPVKEKLNKIEINRMQKGCIVVISTSVATQEIVKIRGMTIQIN